MGAIKNIWTILEGDKKVREFAESFGPGMPIMSNITAYYKKQDEQKEYEKAKKEYYMRKRIEEEYEREHGRR